MSRTTDIYRDKLSLELFRQGKRPVDDVTTANGLLFINTKTTGSTKIAIRPKSGQFTIGSQTNQNPSAEVNAKTNYLLFCDNVPVTTTVNCANAVNITNRATLDGTFVLEKNGVIDGTEHDMLSLLTKIESDPNLVVLYDHDDFAGLKTQVIICPDLWISGTSEFYIELNGIHINPNKENIIEALLKYGESQGLKVGGNNPNTISELLGYSSVYVHNFNNTTHKLYMRYTGADTEIMAKTTTATPIIFTADAVGYSVDPDGLGAMIAFSGNNTAMLTLAPWYQYSIGNKAVEGVRYVLNINGIEYRDARPNTANVSHSLMTIVEQNPELAKLVTVDSGGAYTRIVNLTSEEMVVKIYLDEEAPYTTSDKSVDDGSNPAGLYKKRKYPYGARNYAGQGYIRDYYVSEPSVHISVTEEGYSFTLGPK